MANEMQTILCFHLQGVQLFFKNKIHEKPNCTKLDLERINKLATNVLLHH